MATQAEIERSKTVAHAFYQAGVDGRLTSFAQYLDADFTVTASNYLRWGGAHRGAAFFSGDILPNLPQLFDFSRFSHRRARSGRPDYQHGRDRHGSRYQDPRSVDHPERQSR
jgi:hypothetical protein